MHASTSAGRSHAPGEKIYTRAVAGRYTRWRWFCVWLTQCVYFGLPWLSWNGRPAVLFDLAARKFYLFGLVLWPQDFIYLAGLLALCAGLLFLLSTLAGRMWCSLACPHTVYTEIFLWIERKIEGDRSARIRLDKQPMSIEKLARKGAKHVAWAGVALWTGLTLVAYFTPMQSLLREIWAFEIGPWQAFWMLFYAGFAYLNAGWMRETICRFLCAYARFQSVMFDADTLLVSYDPARGEPRGARKTWRAGSGPALGECIDCRLCVQVCPTGIDIRNGLQFECIDCAACIDACDTVMDKIGAERGLVRYTSENAARLGLSKREVGRRLRRPRVLVYAVLLAAGTIAGVGSLAARAPLKLDVIKDRAAQDRQPDGTTLENLYRLHVMNTGELPHDYRISVAGLESIRLASNPVVHVEAVTNRLVAVRVQVERNKVPHGSHPIRFELQALDNPELRVVEQGVFVVSRTN